MQRPRTAIKLTASKYAKVLHLANYTVSKMTDNPNFTGDTSPSLTDVSAASVQLDAAISARGDVHNHGTTADMLNLRYKSLTLLLLLKALAAYVENVAQLAAGDNYDLMAEIIASSGFGLRAARNPIGVLEPVQDLHVFISRTLNPNQLKLKWKRPANSNSDANINLYKIYKSNSPMNFSTLEVYATTTRTTFLDINNSNVPQTWSYWVVAVGSAGDGAVSSPITVTVLSM